jgi:hypothetical protein
MSPPKVDKLVENCGSNCPKPCPTRPAAGLPVEEAVGYNETQQVQQKN